MWRLLPNQPPFEMVDGPMAGRAFAHGLLYDEIPESDASRFEPVDVPAVIPPRPFGAVTATATEDEDHA